MERLIREAEKVVESKLPAPSKQPFSGKEAAAPKPSDVKHCKHCAMIIPQKARICPYCRRRVAGMSVFVVCILLFFGLTILGIIISSLGKGPSGTRLGRTPSVSQEGRLDSGGELTPVAVSEAAFEA